MSAQKVSLQKANIFTDVACYTQNIAELANEMDDQFINEDNDFVEIDVMTVFQILQTVWDQVKETALECEGKEIKVKLPDNWIGMVLRAALSAVGLSL